MEEGKEKGDKRGRGKSRDWVLSGDKLNPTFEQSLVFV